jgi:hypothetical protein
MPLAVGKILMYCPGGGSGMKGVPMIELVSRNVLVRGSNRKQIMAWLRRSLRLGQQVGDFVLKITIERIGRRFEVKAQVHDHAGNFVCRSRGHELMDTCREIAQRLSTQLHNQRLNRLAA